MRSRVLGEDLVLQKLLPKGNVLGSKQSVSRSSRKWTGPRPRTLSVNQSFLRHLMSSYVTSAGSAPGAVASTGRGDYAEHTEHIVVWSAWGTSQWTTVAARQAKTYTIGKVGWASGTARSGRRSTTACASRGDAESLTGKFAYTVVEATGYPIAEGHVGGGLGTCYRDAGGRGVGPEDKSRYFTSWEDRRLRAFIYCCYAANRLQGWTDGAAVSCEDRWRKQDGACGRPPAKRASKAGWLAG